MIKKDIKLRLFIIILGVVLFVSAYAIINRLGALELLSRLSEGNIGLGLIFVIGILASFHCVGMCGGFIVTYSASNLKKKRNSMTPHLQYNFGRLISYTLIGAILGGIGSFFVINPAFSGYVLLLASVFMVLMGLSLISEHKLINKILPKVPVFIIRLLVKNKNSKNPKGPLYVGLMTGFMPCGPLQAIQLFALTTGSALFGALAMGTYALGTIPVLLLFGGLLNLFKNINVKSLMRASGFVVIILGLMILNRGLTNFGLGLRSLIPSESIAQSGSVQSTGKYQEVRMKVAYRGYEPNVLYIQKDVPVRWIIEADEMTNCTNEILLPEYNIKQKLSKGETVVEFTPTRIGEIKFSCWMEMVWGKFIVTDELGSAPPENRASAIQPASVAESTCSGSGSCGGSCGGGGSSSSCGCGGDY